jgi:hypothetical protein
MAEDVRPDIVMQTKHGTGGAVAFLLCPIDLFRAFFFPYDR